LDDGYDTIDVRARFNALLILLIIIHFSIAIRAAISFKEGHLKLKKWWRGINFIVYFVILLLALLWTLDEAAMVCMGLHET
jgi:hypothetical protein